jgi:UDP-3-O-[3-hydroxymyristoyl] glucosamine N-acyltransferase
VLAALLDLFTKPVHAPPGIAPSAVIDPSAKIGATVSIGPLATVGPDADIGAGTIIMAQVTIGAAAKVGADCLFHPGARIGERVVIGDRAIVHHNASIGADGFSFVTPEVASHERAKHGGDTATARNRGIRRINSIGTVIIGNDVEIGASAAIDRANLGATTIGDGTKIDNHVQIAHNVTIGKDCLLSGQTGISGSVKIGDRVVMAGKSAVVDHVTIGDDVVVGGGSAVWRDVAPGQVMVGYPAVPRNEAFEREVNIGRLKRIIKDVTALKRRLTVMERK